MHTDIYWRADRRVDTYKVVLNYTYIYYTIYTQVSTVTLRSSAIVTKTDGFIDRKPTENY